MSNKKGFTLVEVLVVMIIIGVLATIFLPNYYNYLEQARATEGVNSLLNIYAAEKNYYFKTGCSFAVYQPDTPPCSIDDQSIANINKTLSLNLNENDFFYQFGMMSSTPQHPIPYLVLLAYRNGPPYHYLLLLNTSLPTETSINGISTNPCCQPMNGGTCPSNVSTVCLNPLPAP